MRLVVIFLAMGAILALCSAVVLKNGRSSEQRIYGVWSETSSEYEKVDHRRKELIYNTPIKEEIYKTVILHQAERWDFRPNGILILHQANGGIEQLNWCIKARGTLLELHHKNQKIEDYQLVWNQDNELTLYLSFDLQVRGIVRMTFKKDEIC